MKTFPMRFLSISLFVLLAACGSYPKKQGFSKILLSETQPGNPYFSDTTMDYVYRADIDVFKNAFSGLLILKKLGNQHHRIVLTTEMGNVLFDFECVGEHFKVNQILPEMDKKVLKDLLRHDFMVLITENPVFTSSYIQENSGLFETQLLSKNYYYAFKGDTLQKIVRVGHGKEKVNFLFSGINNNIAQQIAIIHANIPLAVHLKRL
ncbi:MAG: hypothetical protein AAGA86_05570 [Bacteroidota bacterium]